MQQNGEHLKDASTSVALTGVGASFFAPLRRAARADFRDCRLVGNNWLFPVLCEGGVVGHAAGRTCGEVVGGRKTVITITRPARIPSGSNPGLRMWGKPHPLGQRGVINRPRFSLVGRAVLHGDSSGSAGTVGDNEALAYHGQPSFSRESRRLGPVPLFPVFCDGATLAARPRDTRREAKQRQWKSPARRSLLGGA